MPIAPHGCQNSIPPLGIPLISQENLPFCEGRFEAHFQGRVSTGSARRCANVCTESSHPDVVVMESAQDLERIDAPGPLNRARNRRIFIQ